MKRLPLLLLFSLAAHSAEVFEASLGRESDLPGGKEADGIRGDFVLRNDKIEAVISHNAANRRANMSTFYGEDGVTPGCLYDLTLRGAANDQLVIYSPAGHGPVSYVRIVDGLPAGEVAVESVTTAGVNKGIYKRNEYRLKDGMQGVLVTTTVKNETDKPQKVMLKADMGRFNSTGQTGEGLFWADAVNPDHKCGYAIASLQTKGTDKTGDDLELAPGQEVTKIRFFAVGTSPAQAVGEALAVKGVKVGTISGQLLDAAGQPITTARILVPAGKTPVVAYPDDKGHYRFKVHLGEIELMIEDRGRAGATIKFPVAEGQTVAPKVTLRDAARIRFDITDDKGQSIPCKAHFSGLDGTPNPNLGPKERAHGCVDQYHSEKGQFTVPIPPGKYRVVVVRGPEYGHLEQEVSVPEAQEVVIKGTLKRLVDTTGWISADFHNHSTPSGDNVCDTDGRIINIAAEHLEFTPTTEHNRFFDWEPTINALGLAAHIKTVKGIELTGSRQHVNAFPFDPVPFAQDGGAPQWNDDPRITVLTLRRWQGERPERWVQFNHPDLSNMFVDRDGDGVEDGGFVGVGDMIDGTESQNGAATNILAEAPFSLSRPAGSLATKVSPNREFIWRQLLNQGLRVTAVGVSDAHSVYGNGVGAWRVYLTSDTDDPANIDWNELWPHAKAGHIVLSTGPFLQVTTADGKIAGDDVSAPGGEVELRVKVQCTDFMTIDRVQVLVNSRPDPKLNFTRQTHPQMFKEGVVKFDEAIKVPLPKDAHLIVVAIDEDGDLKTQYGTSDYAKIRPCAYNNPIYVDVDGGGFKPNGDTLGFDLPVMGITADKAKAMLEKR